MVSLKISIILLDPARLMKIDYVVSTMVFWWREHHLSFELECDFLKSLGFGVEIWPTIKGQTECRFNRKNWSRLKDATGDMKVLLHGRVDGPTMEEWQEQILCAKMLGASITTHLESICVSDTLDVADWSFAGDVVAFAKENGVMLCIETGRVRTMLEVGSRFKSIYYCFNTGHARLNDDEDFETYVDEMAQRTRIVHLTDNYGQFDDHQPPGVHGGIGRHSWNYLLDALKRYDNDIIGSFEMFPSMPGVLIKCASNYIFDQLGWPDQPKKAENYQQRYYRPI